MFILEIVDNDVCEVSLGYICYLYFPVRDPVIISPSTQILDHGFLSIKSAYHVLKRLDSRKHSILSAHKHLAQR